MMTMTAFKNSDYNLKDVVLFQTVENLGEFAKQVIIETLEHQTLTLEEALSAAIEIAIDDTRLALDNLFESASDQLGFTINDEYFGKILDGMPRYDFEVVINKEGLALVEQDCKGTEPIESLDIICHLELSIQLEEKDLILLSLSGKLYTVVNGIYDKIGTEYLYINGKHYSNYI